MSYYPESYYVVWEYDRDDDKWHCYAINAWNESHAAVVCRNLGMEDFSVGEVMTKEEAEELNLL